MKRLNIVLRLVASGVLLQTLYFKFSGAPESKFIFASLGVEPYGRLFAGFAELVASVLILIPSLQTLGAVAAIGIMLGAIASHFFVLGIVVQGDGGLLFGLAWAVLLCSMGILIQKRNDFRRILSEALRFRPKQA